MVEFTNEFILGPKHLCALIYIELYGIIQWDLFDEEVTFSWFSEKKYAILSCETNYKNDLHDLVNHISALTSVTFCCKTGVVSRPAKS